MSEIIHYCWLHLSDIHFGHGDSSNQWDQKLVLNQILYDMENREEKKLPAANAIFVTGDIASTGGVKPSENNTEYEDAKKWLTKLADSLKIKSEDIFVVPGNHDLQRNLITDRKIRRLLKELQDDNEPIDNALADSDDRKLLLSLFQNYINFSDSFGPTNISNVKDTFWHTKMNLDSNITLTIVALNTSFLSTGIQDKGHLQLGNEQLKYMLDLSSENEVVIVLSHHPLEWLADKTNVSSWVTNHGHIHLCGHIHDADSERCRKGGGKSFIRVVSGAAHSDSEIVGHGYSLSAIISEGNKLFLRVWPRKWSSQNKIFRADYDNVPENQLFADHQINVKYTLPITQNPSVIEDAKKTTISLKITKNSDPTPSLNVWVGREIELKHFDDQTIKVFAITGIGGQGKSVLASKYIELLPNGTFWDWRDCREESDTFQTQILNIIERITDGKITACAFCNETMETILDYFFSIIEDYSGVFVFDNIDHYVDIDENKPTLGVNTLIEYALKRKHKSKFILTSRPEVRYGDPSFFQIVLPGMNSEETLQLFELRGVKVTDHKTKDLIDKIRCLTDGHPMWLNVIALQVSKNNKNMSVTIEELENGSNTDLDITMMRTIWKTLNNNQKTVLRCMAETVKPETHGRIEEYLSHQIKSNRVSKAIKTLKSLNLIVLKKSPNERDTLELHPIVKAFIRNEYYRSDQIKFIDIIATHFDKFITKYGAKNLIDCVSFGILENWTLRAELAINAGRYKDALKTLDEVSESMLSAGHAEEYIRVSAKLFHNIDYNEAILQDYKYFDDVIEDYVQQLTHLGRYDDAEVILNKYEDLIGKTARYVNLCNMRCYLYWWRGSYEEAKAWGKAGVNLKRSSSIDTRFDCSSHYALAQRDSGETENALEHFLEGVPLDLVLNKDDIDKEKRGEFYGNIGRCLYLKGDIKDALICYRKSLILLETRKSKLTTLNRGWGYYWIGEALEKLKDSKTAFAFYRKAIEIWEAYAPPKAEKAIAALQKIEKENMAEVIEGKYDDKNFDSLCKNYLYPKA